MRLTGVEILADDLSNLKPDTMLVVVSDNEGKTKYIKIDGHPIADNELILQVRANVAGGEALLKTGCYVWNGVRYVWTDPCP